MTWDDEGRYRSNDNATFWQGYAGYPVIMALMLQGRVPFNGEVAAWFKGIPWKALNDAHKRDYAAALAEAFERAGLDMPRQLQAEEAAAEVMEACGSCPLLSGGRRGGSGQGDGLDVRSQVKRSHGDCGLRCERCRATLLGPGTLHAGAGEGRRRRPRRAARAPTASSASVAASPVCGTPR